MMATRLAKPSSHQQQSHATPLPPCRMARYPEHKLPGKSAARSWPVLGCTAALTHERHLQSAFFCSRLDVVTPLLLHIRNTQPYFAVRRGCPRHYVLLHSLQHILLARGGTQVELGFRSGQNLKIPKWRCASPPLFAYLF